MHSFNAMTDSRELLTQLLASPDGKVPAPLVRRLLAWLRLAAPALLAGRVPPDLVSPVAKSDAPRSSVPRRDYRRRGL